MTIDHHPSDELILDYASGALGEAWSIALATHLALCPTCRKAAVIMEGIGGSLLDSISPDDRDASAAREGDGFDALLARIGDDPEAPCAFDPAPMIMSKRPLLPQPLRAYLGGDLDEAPWKRLGMGAHQCILPTDEAGATARLLRIPAGQAVPEHSHGGLELTLVLCGAFSDETGSYGRGDLQVADEELRHQPFAAPGEDCICLAVTDAPLRFSSVAARLVQPWLNI